MIDKTKTPVRFFEVLKEIEIEQNLPKFVRVGVIIKYGTTPGWNRRVRLFVSDWADGRPIVNCFTKYEDGTPTHIVAQVGKSKTQLIFKLKQAYKVYL